MINPYRPTELSDDTNDEVDEEKILEESIRELTRKSGIWLIVAGAILFVLLQPLLPASFTGSIRGLAVRASPLFLSLLGGFVAKEIRFAQALARLITGLSFFIGLFVLIFSIAAQAPGIATGVLLGMVVTAFPPWWWLQKVLPLRREAESRARLRRALE
ncbi:MAG: hypothetical protein AAFV88_15600 [Planctomycetota bacterium]